MPYINQKDKDNFANLSSPGKLNYVISSYLDEYLQKNGLNYSNLNAAIGVLECAKLELYRRIVVPYEDKKLQENGDVYTV